MRRRDAVCFKTATSSYDCTRVASLRFENEATRNGEIAARKSNVKGRNERDTVDLIPATKTRGGVDGSNQVLVLTWGPSSGVILMELSMVC
jgi:hypothetical protein